MGLAAGARVPGLSQDHRKCGHRLLLKSHSHGRVGRSQAHRDWTGTRDVPSSGCGRRCRRKTIRSYYKGTVICKYDGRFLY